MFYGPLRDHSTQTDWIYVILKYNGEQKAQLGKKNVKNNPEGTVMKHR